MEFEGKVALVTGAGQGIGKALALYFAANGAKVVVNDAGLETNGTPSENLQDIAAKVVAEIKTSGGEAVASQAKVGTLAVGKELLELALDSFGQIDFVVNNAAILRDRMLFNMSEEEWLDVINVNLNGTFGVIRAALPHMKERKSGRLINIVSTAGIMGNLGQANYAASKGAIISLTRVCAFDMLRYNVTANCIAPFARTRITDSIKPSTPELEEYIEGAKKVLPEQVAPLVGYLCSDAGQVMSGQLLGVRGKEVFIFSQAQKAHSLMNHKGWSQPELAKAIEVDWIGKGLLTPLHTDLEIFNYPPFI
jgi:NAD(P)-dependent dehydrogenase (short-subunit alcohol dehydrogenase family)